MIVEMKNEVTNYDKRHGSPYDRGAADAYYGRRFYPHYNAWDKSPVRVEILDPDAPEYDAYMAGYNSVEPGDQKDYG